MLLLPFNKAVRLFIRVILPRLRLYILYLKPALKSVIFRQFKKKKMLPKLAWLSCDVEGGEEYT